MDHTPPVVQQIIETTHGRTVARCTVPETGAVAETYLLDLNRRDTSTTIGEDAGCEDTGAEGNGFHEDRVVCKIGGANIWTDSVVEPFVIGLVDRGTTIPVPRPLAAGSVEAGERTDRWALYEYCEGTVPSASTGQPAPSVLRAAGRYLGELHAAFEFDRMGGLVRDDRSPTGLRLVDLPPRALVPSLLEIAMGVTPAEGNRRPVLAHGDYFPGNVLVADGGISAVLDWGNAHVTDAAYSLARAETRFVDMQADGNSAHLRAAFREGYRRSAPLPPNYGERFPGYRRLWLFQSAINLAHVARTARGRLQLFRQLRNWLGDIGLVGQLTIPFEG